MKHTSIALLVGFALSAPSMAEDSYRSHDAHVHGHVEVNIAQDGAELLLEITAPGADIVGFEHAPTNKQEQDAIKQATALLNQPSEIFQFASSAQCQLTFKSVTNTLESGQKDEHEHHDHDEHDHDKHEHHDHDEHDHDKHEHHDHDEHDHDKHEHDHDKHEHHDHDEHDHD
ncbi:DUF2796 domain-containing protein, partial [Vibrio profundi]|uniref:ZrgA family zinc uptake protein n=1 Tax=Vibrio profundi TaxID=1774960 RepID=UPI0037356E0A